MFKFNLSTLDTRKIEVQMYNLFDSKMLHLWKYNPIKDNPYRGSEFSII